MSEGHNRPPITPPTDTEFLDDLKRRYPEIEKKIADFEAALATFPDKLTLADEDVAAALQDLLGQIKKERTIWGAHKKSEKKPWDGLVKIVQNFFGKAEDKADGWIEKWKPIHQQFLDLKRDEAERKAREEAQRQKDEAERLRKEAEAAEQRAAEARRQEAEARQREEDARKEAERQDQLRKEAEARAEEAKREEARLAKEKKEREDAERDANKAAIADIREQMKRVEQLHEICEGLTATDDEAAELELLIRGNGTISRTARIVIGSALLTDAQSEYMAKLKARLTELRAAANARYDEKERKRREKEQREADERAANDARLREEARQRDEAKREEARIAREKAEEEAAAAKLAGKTATGEVRAARADQREAAGTAKEAERDEARHATDAERAANRGDRIESRLEKQTDADLSRTRGELGTVGSLTGRWGYEIVDRDALLATLGPLAPYLMEDAVDAAVYRWMRAHQGEFQGERVEGRLVGTVFIWIRDTRIA